jgi:serine/threonine protein kinase
VFYFLCGYRHSGGIFYEPDVPESEESALAECKSLLAQIEAYVGEIPESLILLSPQRDLFYDCKSGFFTRHCNPLPSTDCMAVDAVKKFPILSPTYTIGDLYENLLRPSRDEEKEATVAFISRCLTIDPNKRPTAKELLDDPWLNDV